MKECTGSALEFFQHMAWHVGAAGVLSFGVYALSKSWKLAALCAAAAFYTDMDHLFGYVLANGMTFDFKSVISGNYFNVVDKRFLWLHSYETLFVVWAWAWAKKKTPAATAFSLGFVSHLVIDQLSYPVKSLAYFLTYRWWHGFGASAFGG